MKYLLVVVSCALMCGCLAGKAQKRADALCNSIAAQGPVTKDFLVRKMGPPTKCAPTQFGEVCEFYRDLGMRTFGPSTYYNGVAFQNQATIQQYEMVRIDFDSKQIAHRPYCEVRY